MKERRSKFWDYLAWICLAYITVWLVLKMFGIINTPDWLAYSPLFAAVYFTGSAMKKLAHVADDVKELKDQMRKVNLKIDILDRNCPHLKC